MTSNPLVQQSNAPNAAAEDASAGMTADLILHHAVHRSHASDDTRLHALYGYYSVGLPAAQIAVIYGKCERTIKNWIKRYEESGCVADAERDIDPRKFTAEMQEWLVQYFQEYPTSYLDEAKVEFEDRWSMEISVSSIWRIIHNHGLSLKVLERRAINIRIQDIIRFVSDLNLIDWTKSSLVFLDEVSFDNRCMWRTRGYFEKGQAPVVSGEFTRLPRVSLLVFVDVQGIIETVMTEGTFDRVKFTDACVQLARSQKVCASAGPRSVWILDGAKIHCHHGIIEYLRSIGIIPIFLPPYCPFYNPIEVMFGLMKQDMKRIYQEGQATAATLPIQVGRIVHKFQNYDMSNIFDHCGYGVASTFDPSRAMKKTVDIVNK